MSLHYRRNHVLHLLLPIHQRTTTHATPHLLFIKVLRNTSDKKNDSSLTDLDSTVLHRKSSVGAARKVYSNWSQETMTCHFSNCFSIVGEQGNAPLMTNSLPSSCYVTIEKALNSNHFNQTKLIDDEWHQWVIDDQSLGYKLISHWLIAIING